jgi:hypothetical protein
LFRGAFLFHAPRQIGGNVNVEFITRDGDNLGAKSLPAVPRVGEWVYINGTDYQVGKVEWFLYTAPNPYTVVTLDEF